MSDDEINKQGGPAFPISIPGVGDNGWSGMTLRDWFAGQALAGMHAAGGDAFSLSAFATAAYKQAEAMLAARNK